MPKKKRPHHATFSDSVIATQPPSPQENIFTRFQVPLRSAISANIHFGGAEFSTNFSYRSWRGWDAHPRLSVAQSERRIRACHALCPSAVSERAEGPPFVSPGQRPGNLSEISRALKGRHYRLDRPFMAVFFWIINPGRCPGLTNGGPLALSAKWTSPFSAHGNCTRGKVHDRL